VTNQRTSRWLFVLLLLASMLGSLMGVPWSIAVLRDPASVWLLVVVGVLFFLTPASAVGVWLGKKVGLGSRLRELVSSLSEGRDHVRLGLLPAMLVGSILGVVGFFAQNSIPKSALIPALNNPNIFEWFLRCFSAALTEEIFFRLGLMTFLVLGIRSIKKPAIDVLSLWIGNLLSALLFASAHFPQLTFHGWSLLRPFVVFSTSAGLILRWLYMRYGLISAIVAHFIADLVVYVIPKLLTVIRFS
jgi:membrane protease YdiL (CAAX protease family)